MRHPLKLGTTARWLHGRATTLVLLFVCCGATTATAQPVADAAASADNKAERIYVSIFAVTGGGFAREIIAINPQTGTSEKIVAEGHEPRLSPDGRRLAFWTFANNNESRDVWVKQLDGEHEPLRVWSGDGSVTSLWTRDGKNLIVSQGIRSAETKQWRYTTWLVDPEKSEASQLQQIPATEDIVDCSQKSDLLLSSNDHNQLSTMLSDGTQVATVTKRDFRVFHGRFSPDNKRVAFVRLVGVVASVCVADVDGQHIQVAFQEKEFTAPSEVGWSPDGTRLAVVLFDWVLNKRGNKSRSMDVDANYRIVLMDPDGSNRRQLTPDRAAAEIGAPEWR